MVRISKNPEERKNELLDAAKDLFIIIGYNRTAVSDIVKKIAVAQGTFYYYFKSKEDIFIAIFYRDMEVSIKNLNERINASCSTALEKLNEFIKLDIENKISNKDVPLVSHLHEEQNAGLHQKVIVTTILSYKPILSKIIVQGIKEDIFKTDYPEEISEFFLTNSHFGLDPGIFNWSESQYEIKFAAMLNFLEKSLSLPKDSLNISKLF